MSPKDVNDERAKLCMRFLLKANFVQEIYYLAHVDQLQVKTVQGVSVIFLQEMANLVKVKASLLLRCHNTCKIPGGDRQSASSVEQEPLVGVEDPSDPVRVTNHGIEKVNGERMKRIVVRKLFGEWGESRPEEYCNRQYIIYREQRQDRGQELQHRVWGVMLWRK